MRRAVGPSRHHAPCRQGEPHECACRRQGKSLAESTTHLRQDYLSITSSCWALWVPVQLVNFSLVPPQHRVVFVNTWNLVWNTVMDYIAHNDTATIIMQREEIKSRLMARLGLGGGPAE